MMHKSIKNEFINIETSNYNLIIEKKSSNFIIKKIKAFNNKGIFLTGIPLNINIKELEKKKYLGQYGKIISIKECLNHNENINNTKDTYSVFVNYNKTIEASFAIQCLNNFFFKKKFLKCSFSTNKICLEYFKKGVCKRNKCFYFHDKLTKENSIIKILEYNNKEIIEFFSQKSNFFIRNNLNKIKKIKIKENSIFPNMHKIWDRFLEKNETDNSSTRNFSSNQKIKKLFENNIN